MHVLWEKEDCPLYKQSVPKQAELRPVSLFCGLLWGKAFPIKFRPHHKPTSLWAHPLISTFIKIPPFSGKLPSWFHRKLVFAHPGCGDTGRRCPETSCHQHCSFVPPSAKATELLAGFGGRGNGAVTQKMQLLSDKHWEGIDPSHPWRSPGQESTGKQQWNSRTGWKQQGYGCSQTHRRCTAGGDLLKGD